MADRWRFLYRIDIIAQGAWRTIDPVHNLIKLSTDMLNVEIRVWPRLSLFLVERHHRYVRIAHEVHSEHFEAVVCIMVS